MTKKKIMIDTDPGIDDAAALAVALFAQEVDVQLITTVAGNVSLDHVTENALKLLTFWNLKIPVAPGASHPLLRPLRDASDVHGKTGLAGYELPAANRNNLLAESAVAAMYRLLQTTAEPLTIVAIGPLTNIALLLCEHPEVKDQIAEIVIMGGALGRGNFGVLSEFNFAIDPEAAQIVFQSGLPLLLTPLEAGAQARLYQSDVEKLRDLNPTGRMLYSFFREYRGGSFATGLKMYDCCALAALLKPQLFTRVDTYAAIETQGNYTAGASIIDLKGLLGQKPNCRVCVATAEAEFRSWFVERIEKIR